MSRSYKLFVGQIPKHYDEEQIRKLFEPYGEIESVFLMKEGATSTSKGAAFVTYKKKQDADLAIANLNGKPVDTVFFLMRFNSI
jgi:RNA recognition motif-containing protein